MKKTLLILSSLFIIITGSAQFNKSKKKQRQQHFKVVEDVVYYDNNPFAKYQAKTFSLDDGQLVEEYNLILVDNKLNNKQLIGDLIDFVSDRHQGAEVEVEVDGKNSVFNL
jgi:hypothetical protein